jgi:hypothetical protein
MPALCHLIVLYTNFLYSIQHEDNNLVVFSRFTTPASVNRRDSVLFSAQTEQPSLFSGTMLPCVNLNHASNPFLV